MWSTSPSSLDWPGKEDVLPFRPTMWYLSSAYIKPLSWSLRSCNGRHRWQDYTIPSIATNPYTESILSWWSSWLWLFPWCTFFNWSRSNQRCHTRWYWRYCWPLRWCSSHTSLSQRPSFCELPDWFDSDTTGLADHVFEWDWPLGSIDFSFSSHLWWQGH